MTVTSEIIPDIAGIVLCGGLSTRMGSPKAWLPFGPDEVLLQRIVRTLREVVFPIVVVAAVGQALPDLPADVLIARDEREALGPLGGLASAFSVLQGRARAAYATACDVPLLNPAVVRRICDSLGEADVAIAVDGKFHHPLAAVYRLTLEHRVRDLLDVQSLRPVYLLEQCHSVEIPVDSLRDLDPELDSFRNCNTPADYAAVLQRAGYDSNSAI